MNTFVLVLSDTAVTRIIGLSLIVCHNIAAVYQLGYILPLLIRRTKCPPDKAKEEQIYTSDIV